MKRRKKKQVIVEKKRKKRKSTKYSKFPLMRHVKNVLDFLKLNRSSFTYEEIREKAPVKLSQHRKVVDLEELLKQNPKIHFDPQTLTFSYEPKFSGVTKIEDVYELLQDPTFLYCGIDTQDLEDCYNGIKEDLERFKTDHLSKNEIYVIPNKNTKSEVLFFNRFPKIKHVHPKLMEEWGNTKTENYPRSNELIDIFLHDECNKYGLERMGKVEWVSDKIHEKRKRALEGTVPKRKKRKLTKLTNIHLVKNVDEQQKYLDKHGSIL